MGIHGGKWVFQNKITGATVSFEVNDTTPSTVAAVESSAAAALGITTSQMTIKNHARGGDPRKGNK